MKKYYCRYQKQKIIKESIINAVEANEDILHTDDPTLWSMSDKNSSLKVAPTLSKENKICN